MKDGKLPQKALNYWKNKEKGKRTVGIQKDQERDGAAKIGVWPLTF